MLFDPGLYFFARCSMITVSQGHLERQFHEYFQRLKQTGEELMVTHNNVPVFKIIPMKKNVMSPKYSPISGEK